MVPIVSLHHKLLWSHIKEMYQNEWVELVDCDWGENSSRPRRAVVRHHAHDRSELLKLISESGSNPRSIVLFVGQSDTVISFEMTGIAA